MSNCSQFSLMCVKHLWSKIFRHNGKNQSLSEEHECSTHWTRRSVLKMNNSSPSTSQQNTHKDIKQKRESRSHHNSANKPSTKSCKPSTSGSNSRKHYKTKMRETSRSSNVMSGHSAQQSTTPTSDPTKRTDITNIDQSSNDSFVAGPVSVMRSFDGEYEYGPYQQDLHNACLFDDCSSMDPPPNKTLLETENWAPDLDSINPAHLDLFYSHARSHSPSLLTPASPPRLRCMESSGPPPYMSGPPPYDTLSIRSSRQTQQPSKDTT